MQIRSPARLPRGSVAGERRLPLTTGQNSAILPPDSYFRDSVMETIPSAKIEDLKSEWTDKFVRVNPDRPELRRFKDIIGRVVTVNWNAKAVIDFQDGGWYDIAASTAFL